jgi:hypothetical protein
MNAFTLKDVLELIGTGAMVLAGVWRISAQLTSIETLFSEHCKKDDAAFAAIERDLDTIAPRAVHLRQARR